MGEGVPCFDDDADFMMIAYTVIGAGYLRRPQSFIFSDFESIHPR